MAVEVTAPFKKPDPGYVRLAVYGSLRKGMGNHPILGDAVEVGPEWVGPYSMYDLGGIPGVTMEPETGYITVEVYDVTEQALARIDLLEGHPDFYRRRTVPTAYGPTEMYFINDEDAATAALRIDDTIIDWCAYLNKRRSKD